MTSSEMKDMVHKFISNLSEQNNRYETIHLLDIWQILRIDKSLTKLDLDKIQTFDSIEKVKAYVSEHAPGISSEKSSTIEIYWNKCNEIEQCDDFIKSTRKTVKFFDSPKATALC